MRPNPNVHNPGLATTIGKRDFDNWRWSMRARLAVLVCSLLDFYFFSVWPLRSRWLSGLMLGMYYLSIGRRVCIARGSSVAKVRPRPRPPGGKYPLPATQADAGTAKTSLGRSYKQIE